MKHNIKQWVPDKIHKACSFISGNSCRAYGAVAFFWAGTLLIQRVPGKLFSGVWKSELVPGLRICGVEPPHSSLASWHQLRHSFTSKMIQKMELLIIIIPTFSF
jgi:hypothetical protein